jgi:hypothetical protein
VLRDLFDLFGNPAAVQRAVEAALPSQGKVEGLRERLLHVTEGLDDVSVSRDRVIRLYSRGKVTEEQVDKVLDELKAREEGLKVERAELHEALGNMPTAEEVKAAAERACKLFRPRADMKLNAQKMHANHYYEEMAWADKQELVEMVFGGTGRNGERFGIRVSLQAGEAHVRGKVWRYRLTGRLLDDWGTADGADRSGDEPQGGPDQRKLLEEVGAGSRRNVKGSVVTAPGARARSPGRLTCSGSCRSRPSSGRRGG